MRGLLSYRLVLATLTVVMLLGATASGAVIIGPAVTFTVTGLATSAADYDGAPCFDGKLITWAHVPGPVQNDMSIAVRNLATGQTRYIGVGDGHNQNAPQVSGDRVVYMDDAAGNNDVKMYRWSTDSITTVVGSNHSEMSPKIDGNLVVWVAAETGYLWYRDYDTGGTLASQVVPAGANADYWEVDNGRIVWLDAETDSLHVLTPRAPGFDGLLGDYDQDISQLRVHGDTLVFTRNTGGNLDAMQYDVRAKTTASVANGLGLAEAAPDVFHDTFAWAEEGAGVWDLGYSRPFRHNSSIGADELDSQPSLYGHRIAYNRSETTYPYDPDVMLAAGNAKLQERKAGANRYATAVAVSQEYFSTSDIVVLCTGENYPDALSAAPLARALEAPLLLTRPDSLPAETLAEITRLGATSCYVIGGEGAVSLAVWDQVNDIPGVNELHRLKGTNRYETSARVARELQLLLGPDLVFRAFFARGDSFPDALSVGPVAAGALGPILLVQTNAVPESIASAIDSLDIKFGYIIGGTGAVSSATANAIGYMIEGNPGSIVPYFKRWSGADRYATATKIIDEGLAAGWIDLDTLGVATGTNFPDALGGGAALGYYGSPVMLTGGTSLSTAAAAFLTAHEYEIGRVDVFGGTGAVSAAVYDGIAAKIK